LSAAVSNYAAARELLPQFTGEIPAALRPERLDANQALAELSLGETVTATETIARAVAADPRNPAFLMTAGFAADRAGRHRTAVRYDTEALASDPGLYPAANDLGVALARLGRTEEAVGALRRAVGAREDYALGWFNLGVVQSSRAPWHLFAAQGAFAKAFALDPALRDAPREPTTDSRTYRTGIDLSQPLPPRWTLAGLPPAAAAPATGLLAVLVLGLTLARAAGAGAQSSLQQWLEALVDRVRWLDRFRHPAWALAATVLVLVVPGVVRAPDRIAESLAVAAGVLVLAAVVLRARSAAARRAGAEIQQQSWGPGIVFGALTCAFTPWAPLPVAKPASPVVRVHVAAPVVLGVIGLVLFLETAAFEVPVVRSLAVAALVMVASVLVPVAPLDGAQVDKVGLLAGAGLLGAAVLTGLSVR
jgi:tetratricopeptide (TPR) repeat protein